MTRLSETYFGIMLGQHAHTWQVNSYQDGSGVLQNFLNGSLVNLMEIFHKIVQGLLEHLRDCTSRFSKAALIVTEFTDQLR